MTIRASEVINPDRRELILPASPRPPPPRAARRSRARRSNTAGRHCCTALRRSTRAWVRIGEMLAEQKATVGLNRGTRLGGSKMDPPDQRPTLKDAGTSTTGISTND